MLRTARSRRAHGALTTARWWKGGGETLYFTATAATVTALHDLLLRARTGTRSEL